MSRRILVGTAGWSIPAHYREHFPEVGSHLERYAAVFDAVEINSSFYRPHRRTTYARWAAAVPSGFRFAAKLPRSITHERRLVDVGDPLDAFAGEVAGLGDKLGALLVQLPPSLPFDMSIARPFFERLKASIDAAPVCEPRHPSWFSDDVSTMLADYGIARVAADPARVAAAAHPAGWPGLRYHRLHGSPVLYRSPYDRAALLDYAAALAAPAPGQAWCIFDNTASMAALGDALALRSLLAGTRG